MSICPSDCLSITGMLFLLFFFCHLFHIFLCFSLINFGFFAGHHIGGGGSIHGI